MPLARVVLSRDLQSQFRVLRLLQWLLRLLRRYERLPVLRPAWSRLPERLQEERAVPWVLQ